MGGGTVPVDAGTVALLNSGVASATTPAAGTATLQVTAQDVQLGTGDKALSGFAVVRLVGRQQITLTDSGALSAGSANLTFDSPMMLVDNVVQVKIGSRSQRIPGARIVTIVAITLIAFSVVPTEEIWIAHIQ